jgi:hypothetical protein
MPSYFPENNTPLPNDSFERLLHKAVSLLNDKLDGAYAPAPSDSPETLLFKFVNALNQISSQDLDSVILKSANNSRWRLTIDNQGIITVGAL